MNTTSGQPFSPTQLTQALYSWEDYAERALLPWVALQQTAKDIIEGNPLSGEKITIGFTAGHLTPEVLSLFNTWQFTPADYGFTYDFQGVPVEIHVIKNHYAWLKNPDMRFYGPAEYHLPNPFQDYWKVRNLIK